MIKHTFILAMTLLLIPVNVIGTEPAEVINLWPGNAPDDERKVGEEGDTTTPDGRLVAGKRVIRLGNVSVPQMYVYLPPREKRSGSAVVICPGGGFSILAWDLEGTEVAEWLNEIGVVAIVLKYRVPTRDVDPRWKLPVQDAQRALSLTRHRAKEWNVYENRVGVLGFSAGGATAGYAALLTERQYEPVDEADKKPCTADAAILVYPAWLTNREMTGLAEGLEVTKSTPPMFLVHAYDDRIPAENCIQVFRALKKAKVPAELHIYDTGGHGYGLRDVEKVPVTTWNERCAEWLQRHNWAANLK